MNERQQEILELLKMSGHVEVDALSQIFNVTTQTIRRDLMDLCDRGLAARIHGGAKRLIPTHIVNYEERRLQGLDDKRKIAKALAKMIPNGATIAINIGTTTEQVAEALKLHENLTIISNNINIARILRPASLRSLIILGGEVRLSDGAIIGSEAVEAIRNFKVDYAIIGASSLDVDGSILDFDAREVAVARAILSNARRTILACDHRKFDVTAPYRIGYLEDLDMIVTNAKPPQQFIDIAEAGDTTIIVAD